MKYVEGLTGLRGIAAHIVFISHAANSGLLPSILGEGFGQVGVILFFVLSGFLMSRIYFVKEFHRESILGYGLARVARVFPLYYFVVIFSILVTWLTAWNYHYQFEYPSKIVYALIMLKAPYELWTIPVEVQFYLMFIFLWFLHSRFANLTPILLLLGGGFMLPPILVAAGYDVGYWPRRSIYFFAFILGTLLAIYIDSGLIQRLSAFLKARGWVLVVLLLPLGVPGIRKLLDLELWTDSFYLNTWFDPIIWILCLLLVLIAQIDFKRFNIFALQPFLYLGEVSYAFYLFHRPILEAFVLTEWNNWIVLFLSYAVTVFLSALSFKMFEKPVGLWIRAQRSRILKFNLFRVNLG